MSSSILKILLKTFLLSIIVYSCYILLTPLKIEILPYVGVLIYSLFIILIYEVFIYIVKTYIDKNRD